MLFFLRDMVPKYLKIQYPFYLKKQDVTALCYIILHIYFLILHFLLHAAQA